MTGRNMHTYEEVAIKTEPMKSVQVLKGYQSYKILGATRNSFTFLYVYMYIFESKIPSFMNVVNHCNPNLVCYIVYD